MRRAHALIAAITLEVASACDPPGSTSGDGAKVASLTKRRTRHQRPNGPTWSRYRLDMTAEDEKALWTPPDDA